MSEQKKTKRALVLSGGGAKGWWQARVAAQIIRSHNMHFDLITGVSVGALNGYLIATHRIDEMLDMWESIRNRDVYRGKVNAWNVAKALITGKTSILDSTPLRKLIAEKVDDVPFIPMRVGTVSLLDGSYRSQELKYETDIDTIRQALYASAAIPMLFRPDIDHNVDGGIRTNSPISDAIAAMPDVNEIYVINCNRLALRYSRPRNLMQVFGRTAEIVLNEGLRNDFNGVKRINNVLELNGPVTWWNGRELRKIGIHLFEPPFPLNDMLDFDGIHRQDIRLPAHLQISAYKL